MKTIVSIFLLCLSVSITFAGQLFTVGDSTCLYDHSDVLTQDEEVELEKKLQKHSEAMNGNVMVILTKGNYHADSIAYSAARTISKDNLVIISADVSQSNYGFFVSEGLKSKFPAWVIEKIQDNYIKRSFKSGDYYGGLDKATEIVAGIAAGTFDIDELRKDKSNSTVLLLIGVVLFFLLVFPVVQYYQMKKNHYSSRPVDVVSAVLLTNTFGTRGKNLFDDFSKGRGEFMEKTPAYSSGGNGIEGYW